MASNRKVIISCAVTGSIHTPTMTPHLPITPDGDRRGRRSARPRRARRSCTSTRATRETAGRRRTRTSSWSSCRDRGGDRRGHQHHHGRRARHDARRAPGRGDRGQPELCSLNMGSMNFGLYPMVDRDTEWQARVGAAYLENTRDFIFRNTFADIERIAAAMSARARDALRVRVLRRRATSTRSRTSSTASWSSRRCSCRRSSGSSAASAPTSRISST